MSSLSLGLPEYLQDSDIVFTCFQRRDVHGAWPQYLGLEHSDNFSKKAYAVNQVEDDISIPPSPILSASTPLATFVVPSTQGLTRSTTRPTPTPQSIDKFISLPPSN